MSGKHSDGNAETGRSLTYADAGVDIAVGNALVDAIKPMIRQTHRRGVIGNVGGFGGLFEIPVDQYSQPVMVSGTDGVGTKLRLAIEMNRHDTIGIDLVAMCVNDIIVCGAEPLWFLDYYATGKLNIDQTSNVIAGIAQGCRQSGMALLGGETAEMPGMYASDDYDLAGFAVGIVEKSKIIDGSGVMAGNCIIGLASSGAHANGYSLIRKLLENNNTDITIGETPLHDALLTPTRIYQSAVARLVSQVKVNAMAHITGGGITENIPRVLPAGTQAQLQSTLCPLPELFQWIQRQGNVTIEEMRRTFNCGIGLVIVVDEADANTALQTLTDAGERASLIGHIVPADGPPTVVFLEDQ